MMIDHRHSTSWQSLSTLVSFRHWFVIRIDTDQTPRSYIGLYSPFAYASSCYPSLDAGAVQETGFGELCPPINQLTIYDGILAALQASKTQLRPSQSRSNTSAAVLGNGVPKPITPLIMDLQAAILPSVCMSILQYLCLYARSAQSD